MLTEVNVDHLEKSFDLVVAHVAVLVLVCLLQVATNPIAES